ncbi:angiotensin-converting enzyme-like [Amphiura filiformis]|uniref:angiotensin-converting enzyme-like n=1 Tax=Amphiura filiformis TaxID=82378 RepID=UPI003B21DDB6
MLRQNNLAIVFLLLSLVYLGSSYQFPDIEYLKSLPEKYDSLLKELACKDLTKRSQLVNCEILMLPDDDTLLTDEDLALEWLEQINAIEVEKSYQGSIAGWNYATNMTDYNQEVKANVSYLKAAWGTIKTKQGRRFDWQNFKNPTLYRIFNLMLRGGKFDDSKQRERYNYVSTEMIDIYGKGQVCRPKGEKYPTREMEPTTKKECLTLEPELEDIIANSRDYDENLWVWKGWRDAVGRKIGELYPDWVELNNVAASNGGYADEGQIWRELYEIPNDGLEEMVDALYEEVKPMYKQLHAFIRRRLAEQYPGRVNRYGPIPAHLLGNMWAQQWNNIYDIAKPYRDVDIIDVTDAMVVQKYNQTHMFRIAERFFVSLGMDPMPENFWKYSMLVKPKDRDVVCHGSAYNFMKDREVRIKMCTEVDMEDLQTIHHEMGHCEYYLQYSDLPVIFRSGANPGFHEAVGDTIALSVVTPNYLHKINLMDTITSSKEATINYQMKIALSKIAFLPFGLMIDKWRWQVFRGNIKPEDYNDKWWEYRLKYQGLVPPIARSSKDFDPGAKYHIPSGTPYIRYFVSYLIQFQFHRALCKEAGFEGPLHECNIYESKEAGNALKEMLSYGTSQPWTDTLEVLTGKRKIDTSAIKEYFEPLMEWLEKENARNNEQIGWGMNKIEDELELLAEKLWEDEYQYNEEREWWY